MYNLGEHEWGAIEAMGVGESGIPRVMNIEDSPCDGG